MSSLPIVSICPFFLLFFLSSSSPSLSRSQVEINLEKFPTKAGQYVFLNVPEVSHLEWHPFTLTSCPELDTVNMHIRICGDWTAKLAERVGMNVLSFRFNDKRIRTSKEAVTFLKQALPQRSINYAFVLADGLVQHPSDEDFTDKVCCLSIDALAGCSHGILTSILFVCLRVCRTCRRLRDTARSTPSR
jgi:hypothetical protein